MKAEAELASLYRERAIARALGSQARPKLRMENRTGDEKKPPVLAARSVKQGGVKVQEDGLTPPLMI